MTSYGFHFDIFSYLLGFFTALLLFFIIRRYRQTFSTLWHGLISQLDPIRDIFQFNLDYQYRRDLINYCQSRHVASLLFPLDELLVTPHVIPIPPIYDPGISLEINDITLNTTPVMPDYPEFASIYGFKSFDLQILASYYPHLILMGNLGTGKTTALIDLLLSLSRYECRTKALESVIPLFIPAKNIHLETGSNLDILDTIINSTVEIFSNNIRKRLSRYVHNLANENKLIVLFDELDELPPSICDKIIDLIILLKKQYPTMRIIVSCSNEYLGNLTHEGFIPVAIKSWDKVEKSEFLEKWRYAWQKAHLDSSDRFQIGEASLLNAWLSQAFHLCTPLEWTFLVWTAYSGAKFGQSIREILLSGITLLGIEQPIKTEIQKQALSYLLDLENKISDSNIPIDGFPRLLSGEHQQIHPLVYCLMSAMGLDPLSDDFHSLWNSKWALSREACKLSLALHNYPTLNLFGSDPELQQFKVFQAESLRYADSKSSGAKTALRDIASTNVNTSLPFPLRAKLFAALLKCPFHEVDQFVTFLAKSPEPGNRHLGALGYGLRQIHEPLEPLVSLLDDNIPTCYQSACLALVAIGSPPALDACMTAFVHGHERLQIASAQALANDPIQGHPILREAVKDSNLQVRKASIHGLSRIDQPWALKVLEEIARTEEQWIIKDFALSSLNQLTIPHPLVPKPQPEPANLPWLIRFASQRGLGLSPGGKNYDIILTALEEGDTETKLAAIDYLRYHPIKEAIPVLKSFCRSQLTDIADASYEALWFTQRTNLI